MAKDVNLSSQEWLDIVFDGKNKDYGAYELRANSVRRHNKSVIIVLSILAVIFALLILLASGVLHFAEEDANAGLDAEQMSLYNGEDDAKEEEEEQVQIEKPEEKIEVPKEDIVNSQAVTEIVIKKDDEVKNTVKEQEAVLENQSQISNRDEDRGSDDQRKEALKEDIVVKPVEKVEPPKPVETKPEVKEQVYTVANVEQKPSFPGGEGAMYSYLSSHIQYPVQAQEEGIEGRVIVEFTVSKTGSIENAHVVKGKHPALDKEALRVVKSMPKWTPARQNGQPVKCTFTLPVQFKMAK